MPQDAFAGPHTVEKLDKLEAYLQAYSKVLKFQNWATIYFDAFAGTGEIPTAQAVQSSTLDLDRDDRAFIVGSAQRALSPNTNFSKYIFVEKTRKKAKELETLKEQHPNKNIEIIAGDANAEILSFCRQTDWKRNRAIVFLDPYGNQVDWMTIEAIAATQAIDLWYLFPAGLGVHRQIARNATFDEDKKKSLTRLFGTTDWVDECIEADDSTPDLFDQDRAVKQKIATPHSITKFMIRRMRDVFKGGVLDEYLSLGSRNHHNYSLLFAWANPSAGAKKAGVIARAVMRSGKRGRAK